MRISDIKQKFASKDKDVIIEALCTAYQYVSKKDKEDLDEILNSLTKEVKEEDKKEITFEEMKKAVNKFKEDTYSQYYYINKKKLSLQKITWVKSSFSSAALLRISWRSRTFSTGLAYSTMTSVSSALTLLSTSSR